MKGPQALQVDGICQVALWRLEIVGCRTGDRIGSSWSQRFRHIRTVEVLHYLLFQQQSDSFTRHNIKLTHTAQSCHNSSSWLILRLHLRLRFPSTLTSALSIVETWTPQIRSPQCSLMRKRQKSGTGQTMVSTSVLVCHVSPKRLLCITHSTGSIRSIDLNVIFKPERAPGIMILGCSVKGTSDQPSDSDHKMYYSPSSQKVATGTYKDRKFTVDSPATSNLEVAAATALQDAYAKLNSQSVAKFLVSVANLMSPEVV